MQTQLRTLSTLRARKSSLAMHCKRSYAPQRPRACHVYQQVDRNALRFQSRHQRRKLRRIPHIERQHPQPRHLVHGKHTVRVEGADQQGVGL